MTTDVSTLRDQITGENVKNQILRKRVTELEAQLDNGRQERLDRETHVLKLEARIAELEAHYWRALSAVDCATRSDKFESILAAVVAIPDGDVEHFFGGTNPDNIVRDFWRGAWDGSHRDASQKVVDKQRESVAEAARLTAETTGCTYAPDALGMDGLCDHVVFATLRQIAEPVLTIQNEARVLRERIAELEAQHSSDNAIAVQAVRERDDALSRLAAVRKLVAGGWVGNPAYSLRAAEALGRVKKILDDAAVADDPAASITAEAREKAHAEVVELMRRREERLTARLREVFSNAAQVARDMPFLLFDVWAAGAKWSAKRIAGETLYQSLKKANVVGDGEATKAAQQRVIEAEIAAVVLAPEPSAEGVTDETPCPERGEEHCGHFNDWPLTCADCGWNGEGVSPACPENGYEAGEHRQLEPYGDPGDGLGVEGFCCKCPASQPGLREELRDLANAVLRIGWDRESKDVHEQAVQIIAKLDTEDAKDDGLVESPATCVLCGHFMLPGQARTGYSDLHEVHKECEAIARAEAAERRWQQIRTLSTDGNNAPDAEEHMARVVAAGITEPSCVGHYTCLVRAVVAGMRATRIAHEVPPESGKPEAGQPTAAEVTNGE